VIVENGDLSTSLTPRVELPIINEGVFLTLLLANSEVVEKASQSQFFGSGNSPLDKWQI